MIQPSRLLAERSEVPFFLPGATSSHFETALFHFEDASFQFEAASLRFQDASFHSEAASSLQCLKNSQGGSRLKLPIMLKLMFKEVVH